MGRKSGNTLKPLRLESVYGVLLYLYELSEDSRYQLTVAEDRGAGKLLIELPLNKGSGDIAALILHYTHPQYHQTRNLEVWRAIARVIARLIQEA